MSVLPPFPQGSVELSYSPDIQRLLGTQLSVPALSKFKSSFVPKSLGSRGANQSVSQHLPTPEHSSGVGKIYTQIYNLKETREDFALCFIRTLFRSNWSGGRGRTESGVGSFIPPLQLLRPCLLKPWQKVSLRVNKLFILSVFTRDVFLVRKTVYGIVF